MSTDALLAETSNHVAILENRRTHLLQELNRVDAELFAARTRYAKLANQTLPVALLPNEILSTIFLLCHGTRVTFTRTLTRPFEVIVSHVSTHWRSVALGTPLLWNTINLHMTDESCEHALQRLSAHLKRSGQCLLNISLYLSIKYRMREVLYLLTSHVQWWSHVSISTEYGSPDDIYFAFRPLSAPNLVHLSLCIGKWDDDTNAPRTEYPKICPTILIEGAPLLTFARVAGKIVGSLSPPLSTIHTFHVDAWPNNLMSLVQFQSLLIALPCLVHLSLTGLSIHLPRDPLQTAESISLPSLRSLRIRGNATPCHRLLSLLSLPSLESLSLQDIGTFDSAVIQSLHSLTLSSCALSSVDLANLFRSFPRVTTLGIDSSTPEIYPLLTPDTRSSTNIPWPELKTISLRQIPPRDVAPFVNGCFRRSQCGSPLQRVYLDRRSRTSVKMKDLLEGLRELQPVENVDDCELWPAGLGYEDSDDVWY